MFFQKNNFKKNSTRLLNICEDLIDKYETNSDKQSCKKDLTKLIKARINAAKEEISNWKDFDTNYIEIAHSMMANATFDLLVSGRYHIYTGTLNPMSCAENLINVYKLSMRYASNNGLIDEETLQEQYQYLMSCISKMG